MAHSDEESHLALTNNKPQQKQVLLDAALFLPLSKALKLSGIAFDDLVEPLLISTPDGGPLRLTLAGYFQLLDRITEVTGDEALNLTSRPLLPGALQFALSQALAATTLEDAMRRIAKSFNLLHGGSYNHVYIQDQCLVYEINIDGFPYPIEMTRAEQDSLLECILVLMHFMFIYLTSDVLEDKLVRVRTRRRLNEKPDASSQLGFWKVHVAGRAPSFSLHYDCSAADLPISLSAENLPKPHAIYGLVADFVNARSKTTPVPVSVSQQVKDLLRDELLSEDDIAAELGLSTRSLRRRLDKEGVSFRSILDKERNRQACKMLSGTAPVSAIAEKLGYADQRSFRRAFLRWNGLTPSAFRQNTERL